MSEDFSIAKAPSLLTMEQVKDIVNEKLAGMREAAATFFDQIGCSCGNDGGDEHSVDCNVHLAFCMRHLEDSAADAGVRAIEERARAEGMALWKAHEIGTSECPLCGKEEPHSHTAEERIGLDLTCAIAQVQSMHHCAAVIGHYLMERDKAIESRVLEKAAAAIRNYNVLHGDLNAGYYAPSSDAEELAQAILALKEQP